MPSDLEHTPLSYPIIQTMMSAVHTTVTQTLLKRDLIIPLQPSTKRIDLARIARTMAELSMFEQHQLAILSPSPSKHEDVAQSTDNVTFECPTLQGDPSLNVKAILTRLSDQIARLDNQVEELQCQLIGERQERVFEQNKLLTRLATLQPVTQRILIDACLSVRGYNTSLGPRKTWIHSNIARLLPPRTTVSGLAFEQKLETCCQQGNHSAHLTESLAIALSFSDTRPTDPDFEFMFYECFTHSIEEELDGRIASTPVEISQDGVAQLQPTPSPVM